MVGYCYVTFATTHFALSAEAALRETTFDFKLVPVPRSISSSCGVALRCSCEEKTAIKEILLQAGVDIEGVYTLEGEQSNKPFPK